MIFVTVGSMLPFERMIRAVDALVPQFPGETFFAQIGGGAYEPANMGWARSLPPGEFKAKVAACRLLVAHAGMGSVISAMECNKPMVLLPRLVEHREVTTAHQVATARRLASKPGIHIADTEADLAETIARALARSAEGEASPQAQAASAEFLAKIRAYILA